MELKITETQAQNLMDLIDLWFFREIRENEDIDNTMWAWNILDVYKQCKGIVDSNKTQESASENKDESDDDLCVDELLEVHFKVKTKSGKNKMLSWLNFKEPRDMVVSFDKDHEKYFGREISFSMKCDGWDTCVTDV